MMTQKNDGTRKKMAQSNSKQHIYHSSTHHVVRVLVLRVQEAVGVNHVIDHVGLADLLGTELLRCRQVPAVVVAEVVVRYDRRRLNPRAYLDYFFCGRGVAKSTRKNKRGEKKKRKKRKNKRQET